MSMTGRPKEKRSREGRMKGGTERKKTRKKDYSEEKTGDREARLGM